jgi:hypothetical protein
VVARLLQLFGNTSNNNAFRISILAALPPALFFLALKNEACRAILGQNGVCVGELLSTYEYSSPNLA